MPTAMKVILLERIETLGNMGDVVKVRTGYARNYLLPQKIALRATKDNIAYFETQRAALEKVNAEKKKEASKQASAIEGLKVSVIRHAAEDGQLYGSVTTRDIAQAIVEQGGKDIGRGQVQLNHALKSIGLFPVTVALHPEVKIQVTVNIARSEEEAKVQAKTGRAVIATGDEGAGEGRKKPSKTGADDGAEAAKAALLEDSALAAEKQESEEAAQKAAEKAQKSARKKTKKTAKPEEGAGAEESEEAGE